ncbi:MAG TPA: four helix bundle protein [Vicinamibacterales bacterium]|nr:four helix bundle protein [Vicinamibacterales bacterium]
MREFIEKLEGRTKQFAIDCVPYCADLERAPGLRNAAFQLSKASGSVAANHRAMRRSRSNREFAAKLQIVCEEADESVLWLEVAEASVPVHLKPTTDTLLAEAKELRAIFSKARSTFRGRL